MSNTRHIVYINEFYHPDICASAAVITEQLPRLLRLRNDLHITVIAGNRAWDTPSRTYPREEVVSGVHVVRVRRPAVRRASLLRRGLGFAMFGRGVIRAASRLDQVDLVIGTTAPPHGGWLARRIAERRGCPFIYRVLDLYPDLVVALGRIKPDGRVHRLWRSVDTTTMRRAAAVVTVARRISERITRTRDLPAAKVFTLHDGFDPGRVEPPTQNAFRQQHNPDGRFVIQYAGNMGLSHPFDAVITAACELAPDRGFLFQFVGDGPRRADLEERLPDEAQRIDYQPAERLGEVLATADVCLISQHAGMFDMAIPYKIYASLSAGKPVIFVGDARSDIAQWLVERGVGVQVDPSDARGLIRVIREFRNTPDRCKRMGIAARAMLNHRFHADIIANQWLRIIDATLGAEPDRV